jgi:alpha-1,3/alpha-1,6-mannosyltransferase
MASHIKPLKIAFVHPDLGIGGAERLVVDAAVALQHAGHQVSLFTAHHDPRRCFKPTRDGTLNVRVAGHAIPAHLAGRLRALCCVARMAALALLVGRQRPRFDIVFCDLVSHTLPLLKRVSRSRLAFYCHFPDQLLTRQRGELYGLYRRPINWLEGRGIARADRVLVNSRFTAERTSRIFPALQDRMVVLHPAVDCDRFRSIPPLTGTSTTNPSGVTLLSINRFDPHKNLHLAIEALAGLRSRLPAGQFASLRLVMAGGYDDQLPEARQTLESLERLADKLRVATHVRFAKSPSDQQIAGLLQASRCVVYTPKNEHFGIVPLEAMAAARPVVAVDSGGPRETILHGRTGYLCPSTGEGFADKLADLVADSVAAREMGTAGRKHVQNRFSHTGFGRRLDQLMRDLMRDDVDHKRGGRVAA